MKPLFQKIRIPNKPKQPNRQTRRPRISYCITCRDRLHHLKQTLPNNINLLKHDPRVQFVLLNYNSSDGLDEWVKNNMINEIKTRKLIYYHEKTTPRFWMSHAKNVAHKLGDGAWLCNLDADTWLPYGLNEFILNRNSNEWVGGLKGGCGTIALLRTDFYRLKGYDEKFLNYGAEDGDLRRRLSKLGRRFISWKKIHKISHEDRHTSNINGVNIKKGHRAQRIISKTRLSMLVNIDINWGSAKITKNWTKTINI